MLFELEPPYCCSTQYITLVHGRQVDDNETSNVDSDVMFGATAEYEDADVLITRTMV